MKYILYIASVIVILFLSIFIYMKITGKNTNALGLGILSSIKSIKGDRVDIKLLDSHDRPPIDHTAWTSILSKYVTDAGQVNYSGLIQDSDEVDTYLNLLSDNPPSKSWSKDQKMTYWINAYNAFTVKLIMNHYPVNSIKDIAGNLPMINSPWDIKFFQIGGIDFDLNTIEHDILRKEFDEVRIHFAINCASISCPKLRNEAYQADILENQLEDQTLTFLANSSKNRIEPDESKISQIFSWFEIDFKQQEHSVLDFIQQYRPEINPKISLEYMDYDWNLNE